MLEYDGSEFAGWQQQARGRTVEAELKRALREITGQELKVYAAGRTDAGAHAEGQVVNFQTDGRISPHKMVAALNARLPADVAVLSAEEVPDEFHARYSARWRRYRYRYLDRPSRPALERGRCWQLRGPLDVDAMAKAAKALVGKHDWTSYCSASEAPADRVREMRPFVWKFTTWPSACAPASVRPAAYTFISWPVISRSARFSSASTVLPCACCCQPANSLPSYSSTTLIFIF